MKLINLSNEEDLTESYILFFRKKNTEEEFTLCAEKE